MSRRWLTRLALLLALATAHAALGLLSLQLFALNDRLPLAWLPSALSLAIVVRLGPAWAVVGPLGLLLFQWTSGLPGWSALPGLMLGQWLGAAAAGWLARRGDAGDALSLAWVLRVALSALCLPLAVVLCHLLSGWTGFGHVLSNEGLLYSSMRLGLSLTLGLASLGPLLLMAARPRAPADAQPTLSGQAGPGERNLGLLALLLGLLAWGWLASDSLRYPLGPSALVLCVLIWAAVRLPLWLAVLVNALSVLLVLGMVGAGLPGLPEPSGPRDLLSLLGYLCLFPLLPTLLAYVIQAQRVEAALDALRARRDALTGLLNRQSFEQQVEPLLAATGTAPLAFVYLDLDNVALVNDTASHAAGDALIAGIASVLAGWCQPGEPAGRISGDEFILLLRNCNALIAEDRVRGLLDHIERYRVGWEGRALSATASAGVVPFLPGEAGFAQLLSHADAACMNAKELGGNRLHFARLQGKVSSDRASALHAAVRLREAIEGERIELHAQRIEPLSVAAQGLHMEILLRVRAEDGSLVPPGEIVPAAERFNLGPRLDRHVLDLCLRQLEAHPAADAIATCSINLTGDSVADESFIAFAMERLRASRFPAQRLCFEITETSAVRNIGRAQRFIGQLRELGCRVALDDFGAGFCSFGYLAQLEVDYFKIDGSFVRDIQHSALSRAVVRSITEIAHTLGKQAIAEHTETEADLACLRELGVDFAQGYLFDRPGPVQQLLASMRAS